jgi:hypothetical protein
MSVTDTKPVTIKDPSYTTPRDGLTLQALCSVRFLEACHAWAYAE